MRNLTRYNLRCYTSVSVVTSHACCAADTAVDLRPHAGGFSQRLLVAPSLPVQVPQLAQAEPVHRHDPGRLPQVVPRGVHADRDAEAVSAERRARVGHVDDDDVIR